MPPRSRRLSLHACLRHRVALFLAIALSASSLPAVALGVDAAGASTRARAWTADAPVRESPAPDAPVLAVPNTPSPEVVGAVSDALGRLWVRTDVNGNGAIDLRPGNDDTATRYRADLLGGSGWWLPNGPVGERWIPIAWSTGAASASVAVTAVADDGRTSAPVSVSLLGDAEGPVATLGPLVVEQGDLVLRWSDTDGPGSGIEWRSVRIKEAPATSTGCGDFRVTGAIALADGTYDQGRISLGAPPTSGCLRVSLELTDLVGHTSITTSSPYRIQPPAAVPAGKVLSAVDHWTGRYNLYRASAFVTQKTFRWCVAASVQMMVNLVRNHKDRTTRTQAKMIAYAQRWDSGPYGEDGGTDVTGWINALRHFGAGTYRAVGASTAAKALRIAATAMRQTGRPAGILVMDGRHAWVLHGFESRTDPRHDTRARISAVRISGPLYPVQQKGGYDPRPNTRMSVKALARYFKPSSVGALVGKYVVVIPTH